MKTGESRGAVAPLGIFPLTAASSQATIRRNVVREFPMFGAANALARRSHALSGGYNDFGTSGLRDFGTSGLRDFGHCHTSDSSSNPPGRLKLSLPGPSLPARRRLTANPLKRKLLKRKLRPLSFRSLNLNSLKLRPFAQDASLGASCTVSGMAGAQPTALTAAPGDLALAPWPGIVTP